MRQAENILRMIAVVSLMLLMVGCGSDVDYLDELSDTYTVSLSPNDTGDTSSTGGSYDIDIAMNVCDYDDDGNPIFEDFYSLYVQTEIVASEDAAGMRIVGFTFYLYPVSGKYNAGGTMTDVMPPALPAGLSGRRHNLTSVAVGAGDTLSIALPIWSQGDKDYYTYTVIPDALGVTGDYAVFQYDLDLILHCEDAGGDTFDLYPTGSTVLQLFDVDNCD